MSSSVTFFSRRHVASMHRPAYNYPHWLRHLSLICDRSLSLVSRLPQTVVSIWNDDKHNYFMCL